MSSQHVEGWNAVKLGLLFLSFTFLLNKDIVYFLEFVIWLACTQRLVPRCILGRQASGLRGLWAHRPSKVAALITSVELLDKTRRRRWLMLLRLPGFHCSTGASWPLLRPKVTRLLLIYLQLRTLRRRSRRVLFRRPQSTVKGTFGEFEFLLRQAEMFCVLASLCWCFVAESCFYGGSVISLDLDGGWPDRPCGLLAFLLCLLYRRRQWCLRRQVIPLRHLKRIRRYRRDFMRIFLNIPHPGVTRKEPSPLLGFLFQFQNDVIWINIRWNFAFAMSQSSCLCFSWFPMTLKHFGLFRFQSLPYRALQRHAHRGPRLHFKNALLRAICASSSIIPWSHLRNINIRLILRFGHNGIDFIHQFGNGIFAHLKMLRLFINFQIWLQAKTTGKWVFINQIVIIWGSIRE